MLFVGGNRDLGGREDILLLPSAETWNSFSTTSSAGGGRINQGCKMCNALGQLDAEQRAKPQQDGLPALPVLDSDLLNLMGGRQDFMCCMAFDFGWVLSFHHNHIKGGLLKIHVGYLRVKMVRLRWF